ncbi:cytochrome P450 [Streptomyces sp. UG1]|uniref:cytochrome P450 n=1 Tax=Streptomyces sp. UG1 TaxID=3417652 RepID=UPI003CF17979
MRHEAVTLLTGAIETTGTTLAWTLYEITRHLQYDDLDPLPYARQVQQEAVRKYGPAWMATRTAARDIDLGGHHIPEGAESASARTSCGASCGSSWRPFCNCGPVSMNQPPSRTSGPASSTTASNRRRHGCQLPRPIARSLESLGGRRVAIRRIRTDQAAARPSRPGALRRETNAARRVSVPTGTDPWHAAGRLGNPARPRGGRRRQAPPLGRALDDGCYCSCAAPPGSRSRGCGRVATIRSPRPRMNAVRKLVASRTLPPHTDTSAWRTPRFLTATWWTPSNASGGTGSSPGA